MDSCINMRINHGRKSVFTISLLSFLENVVDELEKNLGRVTVITGSLKVSRSFPIVSLDFFKNLKEIQGTSTEDTVEKKSHYSLEILENENLQKLFPEDSKVKITTRNGPRGTPKPGRPFIHYNQKLCRSEIKKLIRESELEDPGAYYEKIEQLFALIICNILLENTQIYQY